MTTEMVIGEYRFYGQILGKGGRTKNGGGAAVFDNKCH
jgi:hypothetical protein